MALPPSLTMPTPGNDIRSASAPAPAAGDAFPPPLEDIIVAPPLIALSMPLFSRDNPTSKVRRDASPPRKERAFDDDFSAYGAAKYSSSKNSNSGVPSSPRVVPHDRCWSSLWGVDDMRRRRRRPHYFRASSKKEYRRRWISLFLSTRLFA